MAMRPDEHILNVCNRFLPLPYAREIARPACFFPNHAM